MAATQASVIGADIALRWSGLSRVSSDDPVGGPVDAELGGGVGLRPDGLASRAARIAARGANRANRRRSALRAAPLRGVAPAGA